MFTLRRLDERRWSIFDDGPGREVFTGTLAECQDWLDHREAAVTDAKAADAATKPGFFRRCALALRRLGGRLTGRAGLAGIAGTGSDGPRPK